MTLRSIAGLAVAAAVAMGAMAANPAGAQEPSAGAVASAKELISLKGGNAMFDNLIPGVVESVKNSLVPTNPNLMRELNEVAAQLRQELGGRRAELTTEVAKIYANHFSEQELKDILAFYRTPLGQKLLKEEPASLDESLRRAQDWANNLSEEVMTRFRVEMKKKGHIL